jgi:hypothetical protein
MGWTAPKDVILQVAGILTVKGGTVPWLNIGGRRYQHELHPEKALSVKWVLNWRHYFYFRIRRKH